MPAYNASKYIGQAIESILSQTFRDFELIIVDDTSTDDTFEIIQKYGGADKRIVVLKNVSNMKLANTLNAGIKICRGKYIARMDADDWSFPDRLCRQFNFMENNPDMAISGGAMEICDEKLQPVSRREYILEDGAIRKQIFMFSPFCHPSVMIRKSVLENLNPVYNPDYNPAEDYDLYFRIGLLGKLGNLPDALIRYRTGGNSMTTGSMKKMELMTIKIRSLYSTSYDMGFRERLYNICHWISVFFVPPSIKIKIFNLIRNSKPENKKRYSVVAIWHAVYRKDSVLEPNLDYAFLQHYFPDRIVISNSLYKGGHTTVSFFLDGRLIKKRKFGFMAYLPDVFRYGAESVLNLFYLSLYGKGNIVYTLDPLSAFVPCLLRNIRFVKKVFFVTKDYSTKRFDNAILNKIYFLLDKYCTHAADANICTADTVMVHKKNKYPGMKNIQFHMPNVPPPWIVESYENIPKIKGKIVYVGNLGEGVNIKGFAELFHVMKVLQTEIPYAKLFIIGEGEHKKELMELAKDNINVLFLGHFPEYKSVLEHVAQSEIGIAMYNGDNCYDEFRDSVKIREYQAFGAIPVTTDVAKANSEEISRYRSGIIIKEFTFKYIRDAILAIMQNPGSMTEFRRNAVKNYEIFKHKYEDQRDLIQNKDC